MPGNAIEHDGDDLREDGGEPRRSTVWSRLVERLSFGATLAGVAAVAIFMGWLLGQYAIQSVTGPRLTTDPLDRPHHADALAPTPPTPDGLGPLTPSSQGTTTPAQPSPPPSAATSATSGASSGIASGAAQATPSSHSQAPSSTPSSPARVTTGGSSAITPPAGGLWRVQAGAFSERGRAESMAAQLRASGFEAFVSSTAPYRVQVGAFSDEARARAIMDELHSGGFEAIVVPPN